MAEVFRGTLTGAEGFAREIAIKRVLPGLSDIGQFGAMFVSEARIASKLSHANIVHVMDFDRDGDGHLFLAMELVDGKDLDAILEAGPVPPSIAVFAITEVLRGLGYAHERGVVHRDVSPRNVLVSWDGAVKVSDFGIAKLRDATISTTIRGKPGYMSPEQARGTNVDGRGDLFAVGVMLWELLAGIPLFPGSTHEAIAQLLFRKIPRPGQVRAGVAADVEAIAMRLLARDPDERYASAEAVIDALASTVDAPRNGRGELVRWLATKFRGAVDTGAATRPMHWRGRRARIGHVVAGATIAIAVGITAGVVIEMVTREPAARAARTSVVGDAPHEPAPIEPAQSNEPVPAHEPIELGPAAIQPVRTVTIDKPAPALRIARRGAVAITPEVAVVVDAGVVDPDAPPVRPFDPDEVGGD
jgi:hypothetical protein